MGGGRRRKRRVSRDGEIPRNKNEKKGKEIEETSRRGEIPGKISRAGRSRRRFRAIRRPSGQSRRLLSLMYVSFFNLNNAVTVSRGTAGGESTKVMLVEEYSRTAGWANAEVSVSDNALEGEGRQAREY